MKRTELEIIHTHNDKFIGCYRIKADKSFFTLGSSTQADAQLLGDNVSGFHAIVELKNDQWVISDLGSDQGTWNNKKPMFSTKVTSPTEITIGEHNLKLIPHNIESQLFAKNHSLDKDGLCYHQIIIKKYNVVVDTLLLNESDPYTIKIGGQERLISSPQSFDWKKYEYGQIEILSRKVMSEALEVDFKDKLASVWDPQLRGPLTVAVVLVFMLGLIIGINPNAPEDEALKDLNKNNKYTRIIYDAKTVKKRKKVAKKNSRKIVAKKQKITKSKSGGGQLSKRMSPTDKVSKSAPRVVSQLRSAKLSQLLGKISKRASSKSNQIQARGIAASATKSSGTALASGGLKASGLNTKGTSFGKNRTISGVSTDGKAGGTSSYRGLSGLSTGSIGSAAVGIVEEETEIQGGLDKSVIARIIKSYLGQIRYCYERQLSSKPDLYGKVLVQFSINASGATLSQKVKKSSLADSLIEGCMLRKIARWKFPKPSGGTVVNVTYPFLFKNTN